MTIPLFIDFETRSAIDLKRRGLWLYSHDSTTDVWCMGYAFGDEPVRLWHNPVALPVDMLPQLPPGELKMSPRVAHHVASGGEVVAHNAPFELAIWNCIMAPRYGWPELKPEQVVCTMARAYAMALPGHLGDTAPALGLRVEKDSTGHTLMLRMCKPINPGAVEQGAAPLWVTDQKAFTFLGQKRSPLWAAQRQGAYCVTDVDVERDVYRRTMPLSDRERRVWLADYRINQRGLYFDEAAIQGALRIRDNVTAELDARMCSLTEGAVAKCSAVPALRGWAADFGVPSDSLAKAVLTDMLEDDGIPPGHPVRQAFELRQEAGRATSVSKLGKIATIAGHDGRVRNLFQYHGAGTGRWAGRDVQPHNFPRDLPKEKTGIIAAIIPLIRAGDAGLIDILYGAPLTVISKLLRAFMSAVSGKTMLGGDWSNVEGRGIAWLAGEEWKLQAFRDADAGLKPDIYTQTYAATFGVPLDEVDSDQRQVGKVMELAFGYQGGRGALNTMADSYGLDPFEPTVADEYKDAWRAKHPRIKRYWWDLQQAAIAATETPGRVYAAGAPGRQVKFKAAGSFLWALLPSNRALCYPYPAVISTDFGKNLTYKSVPAAKEWGIYHKAKEEGRLDTYRGPVVDDRTSTRRWARIKTYGGKLSENVTQALCRDFLAEALLKMEDAGFPVVLHMHDEVEAEVAPKDGALEAFTEIMNAPPVWAADFPLVADCWQHERYTKG